MDAATTVFGQDLRRAETLSKSSELDSTWGVKAETGLITLFKGDNYALRDVNYDESFEIAPNIQFSGTDEFVFAKLSGAPIVNGSLMFSLNNETRNVTINEKGMVEY